ncbi:hypothetical protein PVAP13_9KG510326 [Panicum virgatum]|uniref:Uncharacterized protein n=1 Tax=Panicum virgatum TaxID=38727 RepID=A0A8T0NXM0_PANVG|nr:hypothetical protein PVAP13_9KG510326 [Panicum virgatum]
MKFILATWKRHQEFRVSEAQTSIAISSSRPNTPAALPSTSNRRIAAINPPNMRMNMSLPVSPCSSPLRQYRQSNRSCLPSPTHPAYSAGAANYSPINNALCPMRPSSGLTDPWLEISQLKTQNFDSPRGL